MLLDSILHWSDSFNKMVSIFQCILLNENHFILIKFSPMFVPTGRIGGNSALVQVMTWALKLDSWRQQVTSHFLNQCWSVSMTPYRVTRPEGVNTLRQRQNGCHFPDTNFKCISLNNKANLRDLIAATGLVILLKLDSNRRFVPRVTLKFDGWPWKIIRHVFYTTSSFNLCIISDPSGNSNWRYSPETANLAQNRLFFEPCDLRIWRMTLKNNRAPLLFYFKLCASFRSHWWIQTWVTVRKRPI